MNIMKKLWRYSSAIAKSTPAKLIKETDSDSIFDNFARSMARSLTRREALKIALTSLVGVTFTKFGVNNAWAASTSMCLCNGTKPYDPAISCCISTGVTQKSPIIDLSSCPGKVPNPTFTCSPNGCGSSVGLPPINNYLGINLKDSCDRLYCCYAKCESDALDCLESFHISLLGLCSVYIPTILVPPGNPIGVKLAGACVAFMVSMRLIAGNNASGIHEELQKLSCNCCGSHTCGGECKPGTYPCLAINDRVLNCCSVGEGCYGSTAGLSKCCPSGWSGWGDTSGIVHCCPPGTHGSNVGGSFKCEKN